MRLWSRDAKRAENSKKLGKVFLFLSFFMFRKAHKMKPILIKTEFYAPFFSFAIHRNGSVQKFRR